MKSSDFLIVGAGILGLTTALELNNRFPRAHIRILEREAIVGIHASGRNSGVLHSGIYYGPGTLKARLCASGAQRMKSFAAEHEIEVRENGKVIVAVEEKEVVVIDRLMENARENNIVVKKLNGAEIRNIEPYTLGVAGIHVPGTAVINSNKVLQVLTKLLTERGVDLVLKQSTDAIDENTKTASCAGRRYAYGYLFNCAGAHADTLAKMVGLSHDYALVPFKGIYYKLREESGYLIKANVYPVPDLTLPFLGIHFTRVISGDVYVGPTAIPALGRENYGIIQGASVEEAVRVLWQLGKLYIKAGAGFRRMVHGELLKYNKRCFLRSARRLVPKLESNDLLPSAKVGIRPQLVNTRHGRLELDFVIEKTATSSHVLNAISPAFTSAFTFSDYLVEHAGL